MKKKYYNTQQQEIVERVMEKLRPVIRRKINELSSTTYNDAADLAGEYRNTAKEKMFRDAAAAQREKERAAEYEKSINIIEDTKVGTKRFVIAEYIPTNIDVLIYFSERNYVAIARVKDDRLINITDKEIKDDIALTFHARTLTKDNVQVISAALEQNIRNARSLANIVNTDLETHISWRYFMGDPMTRVASKSTEGNYQYMKDDVIGGKHFAVAKYMSDHLSYSIFYILIGDEEKSSMMCVYKMVKGNRVTGHKRPGPIWKMFKNADEAGKSNKTGWTKEVAVPTPASCDIVNLYDMLESMPGQTVRLLFNNIRRITDTSVSMDDVDHAYLVATGQEDADEAELNLIDNGGAAVEDSDNGSDFMV